VRWGGAAEKKGGEVGENGDAARMKGGVWSRWGRGQEEGRPAVPGERTAGDGGARRVRDRRGESVGGNGGERAVRARVWGCAGPATVLCGDELGLGDL
jgi:hypothetical protein